MTFLADFMPQTTEDRDLKSETEVYVRMMVENVQRMKDLCPLDTPKKTDQIIHFWNKFYEFIAFTTLDIELENAILKHPKIVKLMPDIRFLLGECEGALEMTWADRVSAETDFTEAWKFFKTTPLHEFYEYLLKTEWAGLQAVMGRAPQSIAILGSGAMPETGVWVTRWAKEHGTEVRLHSLEIVPERLEKSKKVYNILCGSDNCSFETGDIKDAPKDLREHDVVYFNASVGATTTEKENILLDIVNRMKSDAFVLTRSTHSIKTMAYPPAQLQTQRIVEKLRPVLTCHLNGERGKNANASFIISRVI